MDGIKLRLREYESTFSFEPLISFMEASGHTFIDCTLRGPDGMTTIYGIYLDLDKILRREDRMVCYIILHEMGHMKRMKKMGKEKVISYLSETNYEKFGNDLVYEEMLADRYACFIYRIINKTDFPVYKTQQLYLPSVREQYKAHTRRLVGMVQGTEESYKKAMDYFII